MCIVKRDGSQHYRRSGLNPDKGFVSLARELFPRSLDILLGGCLSRHLSCDGSPFFGYSLSL
jgi:hypothetical protein